MQEAQDHLVAMLLSTKKLTSQVIDTHVLRGYGIYSDHFLVTSKIKLMTKWIKPKHKRSECKVLQVSLLEVESIINVYKAHLNQQIKEAYIKNTVNEAWDGIKNMILKSAFEVLGKTKRSYRKKGPEI